MTQERLAELSSLSVRAISDLERGVSQAPRLETIALLAQALDVTDDETRELRALAREPRDDEGDRATAEPIAPSFPAPPTPLLGRERDDAVTKALAAEL